MPYIILGMAATVIVFPFMALCYIWNSLVGLIVTMLVVLVIMNIYRSPAVALMPDVTPKPLRSTANGLINLVGYFGPILITVVNMVPFLKIGRDETSLVKLLVPVAVVLISLIAAMVVLILKINEPKILEEVKDDLELGEELSTTVEKVEEDKDAKTTLYIALTDKIFIADPHGGESCFECPGLFEHSIIVLGLYPYFL